MTRGNCAAVRFAAAPCQPDGGGYVKPSKKHCQAREAGSSLVLYYTLWEAVHHGTDTSKIGSVFSIIIGG